MKKKIVEWESNTSGSCQGLENVPPGAVVTSIDGMEVLGRCEVCMKYIHEGMPYQIDEDGVMWCVDDDCEPCEASKQEEPLAVQLEKLKKAYKFVVQSHEYGIVATQAAYIAGKNEGGEMCMEWIGNYLWGPGLIPSDEDIKAGADAYCEKYLKLPGSED